MNETNNRDLMPLNKFLAHAGVASRRNAVGIIASGKVVVNGNKIQEPGFKVSSKDIITVDGERISNQKDGVYILLNKPINTITTTSDTHGRVTVMDLVKDASTEKIYPVGRLDKHTTGALILTNDGNLTQKLSHPKFEIKKIYIATLDLPLSMSDIKKISKGLELEDGLIVPDGVYYTDPTNKKIIQLEIHSGKNRIVRRIFEHLGYEVKKLDRISFANIELTNLARGKWRFLSNREVKALKS